MSQNSENEASVSILCRLRVEKEACRVLVMVKKKLSIDLARMKSHLFI